MTAAHRFPDVVILAGGKGTRLSGTLAVGTPKTLAPIKGRPFLHYLLDQLSQGGAQRVVLSLGVHAEAVLSAVGPRYGHLSVSHVIEHSPLGTGGAIKLALENVATEHALVLNGDTILMADFLPMIDQHHACRPDVTVGCVHVPDVGRFGQMIVEERKISKFSEKAASGPGLINAGIYVMRRDILTKFPAEQFSFEHDYLAKNSNSMKLEAFMFETAFLDIGVPADLARAEQVLCGSKSSESSPLP